MKLLNVVAILCLLPLIFSACQVPQNIDIGGAVREGVKAGVQAADKNQDGTLTHTEIRDSKNDPMFWLAIAGAVSGLLGMNGSRKAQQGVDELYDRSAAPKS